jgi:hypothetical protein
MVSQERVGERAAVAKWTPTYAWALLRFCGEGNRYTNDADILSPANKSSETEDSVEYLTCQYCWTILRRDERDARDQSVHGASRPLKPGYFWQILLESWSTWCGKWVVGMLRAQVGFAMPDVGKEGPQINEQVWEQGLAIRDLRSNW